MNIALVVGIILVPIVATVIIGVSYERRVKRHNPEQGDELRDYFNKEHPKLLEE